MRSLILYLVFSLSIVSCTRVHINDNTFLHDRRIIIEALCEHGVFNEKRQTIHVSNTCSLRIDNELFPVVDIREIVKGAVVPRGANYIVVLNADLSPLQKIEYTTQRPLYCANNQLFVFGDLMLDGHLPEGNVLTFSNHGRDITITYIDPNDFPEGMNCQ